MKNIVNLLLFLFVFLSACSDDSILEELKPEPPKSDVEEPKPDDDSENSGDNQNSVLPILNVVGRYLKNEKGEIINLHGFTQTYSPFFNNNAWNDYDVQGCLNYNKSMVDGILAAGWKFNFVRMHLDPYWSDDPTMQSVRYEGHERFSETRFRKYLDELFVPMAEYFMSKGMYVVMRPPGVCPNEAPYQGIELGDSYQQFLLKVWDIVSQHPKLKNNTGVMFELANEPVKIKGTDGTYGSTDDGHFQNLQLYFQAIVDKIRANCRNIIWVPGLSYQSSYAGYAKHRIQGENIGFAVHCYPGWYGSDAEEDSSEGIGSSTGGGYESFQRGWDAQVQKESASFLIIKQIQAIYREEGKLKELSSKERLVQRQVVVKPLVDALFVYLKQHESEVGTEKLREAFTYALNQEKYLWVFLTDEDVPMDNNASERAIRGFCVGMKNWQMIDTINGAKSSAIIYSIAETAKANNLKPYEYFEYLLTEIPKHMGDTDRSFLDNQVPWSEMLPESIRKPKKIN